MSAIVRLYLVASCLLACESLPAHAACPAPAAAEADVTAAVTANCVATMEGGRRPINDGNSSTGRDTF